MLVDDVHDTFERGRELSVFRLLRGVRKMVGVRTNPIKHAHGLSTVRLHGASPRLASYLRGRHLYSCSSASNPRISASLNTVLDVTLPSMAIERSLATLGRSASARFTSSRGTRIETRASAVPFPTTTTRPIVDATVARLDAIGRP